MMIEHPRNLTDEWKDIFGRVLKSHTKKVITMCFKAPNLAIGQKADLKWVLSYKQEGCMLELTDCGTLPYLGRGRH